MEFTISKKTVRLQGLASPNLLVEKKIGVITLFPHQLPAIVNMPP
jgi:hypothetical protein